ncbi:putative uncharacterized protein DDB_G0282133 [Centruroides sculpturatus]|uniref:putative uncharacterized protein DDB_G0282133 n=1 Tax=Centruroides sculpturatus TaxID=218467 RepID=UPI000C6EC202|nr:putative uncharacterized protein DDB_G0282133 [Centruroides sculpturatus]
MKMGKLTEFFNLYEIISKMRKQRIAMVQTKEQYILVHRAVAALFEHQLELIDNHIYENLDENGHPLLKDTEILNSHEAMNEENENSFEMKKQDYTMDFKKETIESSLSEESDTTITNDDLENTNYESFDVGNETANNINYSINDYNCDQNVNFTISLPLNPSKTFTDNLSVSTTITYNDDKILVDSKQNENKNTSSNINECGSHTNETELDSNRNNFTNTETEINPSFCIPCEKEDKSSENNCNNLTYKTNDIEEIFLQILNDDNRQATEKLDDKAKSNKDVSSKTVQTIENTNDGNNEMTEEYFNEMSDQNPVNIFEKDTVLHNLTSELALASRQRYICLVTECEQSFSEIERLLEEKNSENSENLISNNNSKEILRFDQIFQNNNHVLEEIETKNMIHPSFNDRSDKFIQEKLETVNNNDLDSLNPKNSDLINEIKTVEQTIDYKINYLKERIDYEKGGIEEALMKKQKDSEEAIEFIDTCSQEILGNECESLQNQQNVNHCIENKLNENNAENYENTNKYENNEKFSKSLHYTIELSNSGINKKSEEFKKILAGRRIGKIFEPEHDHLNFKQERCSSICISNFQCVDEKQDVETSLKGKENCNNTNNTFLESKNCEYDDFANQSSENEKSAVAQKPSIAKLKALFEKPIIIDENTRKSKQKQSHPLSRSHSHHIHSNKSDILYSNEKTVLKPTLFNKVSKIFHAPSYEEHKKIHNSKLNAYKYNEGTETTALPMEVREQFSNANESKSQWYDDSKKPYSDVNLSLNSEDHLQLDKNSMTEINRRNSENAEVGCLDISSLMSSIISGEQNINQTQWYEQNSLLYKDANKKDNFTQNISKEKCTIKEYNNNEQSSLISDCSKGKESNKLYQTSAVNLPEANKNKLQNISFNSCQEANHNEKQMSTDKLEATTKWYFKKESDNDIENSNMNDVNSDSELQSCQNIVRAQQENIGNLSQNMTESNLDSFLNQQPPLPPKKKNDKPKNSTSWYLNENSQHLNMKSSTGNVDHKEHVAAYANVIKMKNGSLIETKDLKKSILYNLNEEKTDLYMNVNPTTKKNIEQIENSLQQHPRGAIIDLTSRQSFANEQQMANNTEQNVKEEKGVLSSDFKGKLKEYKKVNPPKKLKGYETIWPQKSNDSQFDNSNLDKKFASNKDILKQQKNFELFQEKSAECKEKPQPKPRSLTSDKQITKSKSSSNIFPKQFNVKNSVSDFTRFKETSVNKVVCELNSILNVLTNRPFKSSKPETSVTEKSTCLSSETSQKIQPSAPPRRKLKQDITDCHLYNSEVNCPDKSNYINRKINDIHNVESNVNQLSKSTTLPNINHLSSRTANESVKENNDKISDFESSKFTQDSKKLYSVYENIDCNQFNIPQVEKQESADNFKSKLYKLKHSTSDASVFAVLRNTKYRKNKLSTDMSIKLEKKLNDDENQTRNLNEKHKIIENKSNNLSESSKQSYQIIKKPERRSMDDMDMFPVAPPRSKRHGPTLKSVSEMEKFTKSLDEVGLKPVISTDALKSLNFPSQQRLQSNYANNDTSNYTQSVSTKIGCSTNTFADTPILKNPVIRTKSLKITPLKKMSHTSAEAKLSNKDVRTSQNDYEASTTSQYAKLSQGSICKNQES